MARAVMRQICGRVFERWPDVARVAMVHRVGVVPVGASSIAIVVAAPHRKAALDAVHFAIDSVKGLVPIWKKEVYAAGPCGGEGHEEEEQEEEEEEEEEEEGEWEWEEQEQEDGEKGVLREGPEAAVTAADGDLAGAKVKERGEVDAAPPCPQWKVNKEWDASRAIEFSQRNSTGIIAPRRRDESSGGGSSSSA
jgi:molybdopterin synthase catalytic subunit